MLHVCLLRECEGDGNVGVGCEYMCGTRGLCVVFSADDVLEVSVVRGVGGVCGMCLARGCVAVRRLDLPIL